MIRWRVVVLGVAAAVLTVAGWWAYEGSVQADSDTKPRLLAQITVVGVALVVCGCVGVARRSNDPQPMLLALAGLALGVGFWRLFEPPWGATLGAGVWMASPLVLAWAVAGSRLGRPATRRVGIAVV